MSFSQLSYNVPHASPLTSAYTFPVVPGWSLIQTWGFAPANPASPADALAYANNRCYAFYLVGSGQLQPLPGQTHVTVVAPDNFMCPYRFAT
jgi:hypothetical protein